MFKEPKLSTGWVQDVRRQSYKLQCSLTRTDNTTTHQANTKLNNTANKLLFTAPTTFKTYICVFVPWQRPSTDRFVSWLDWCGVNLQWHLSSLQGETGIRKKWGMGQCELSVTIVWQHKPGDSCDLFIGSQHLMSLCVKANTGHVTDGQQTRNDAGNAGWTFKGGLMSFKLLNKKEIEWGNS